MELNKKNLKNSTKKGEIIELKTDFPNITIDDKLKNFKSLSVNKILYQPMKEKKIGIKSVNKGVRKGFRNNILISLDITKQNLDIINTMEIISQPDFKASINTALIQGNNKNNTLKILLKENYSHYITSLKKIYSTFKLNHYKRSDKTFSEEYIKNYGEERNINNRHYNNLNTGEYYRLDLIIKKKIIRNIKKVIYLKLWELNIISNVSRKILK